MFCVYRTSPEELCQFEIVNSLYKTFYTFRHIQNNYIYNNTFLYVNIAVVVLLCGGGLEDDLDLLARLRLRVVLIISLASLSSRSNHGSSNSLREEVVTAHTRGHGDILGFHVRYSTSKC